MPKRQVTVQQVKEGIAKYHGKSWLFECLKAGGWQDGHNASRITINDVDINIYISHEVIRLGLWYSRTAHVETYVGHPTAVDLEISKLYERFEYSTNYYYEREQKVNT